MAINDLTKSYLEEARGSGPAYWKYLPDDVLYRKLQRENEI